MKISKYLGNPYVFISLYLLILLEGEHFGGFYLLYLLLALPHGGDYAIVSVAGIAILLVGYHSKKELFQKVVIPIGVLVMISGLIVFFNKGTAEETFTMAIPIITFILCGISGTCLLINYFTQHYITSIHSNTRKI